MKIQGRRLLSVLVVLTMLCTSFLSGNVLAADLGSTTVFDKNGLKADFKVDSQWTGFFNGTITVTNTGTQPVEDWALTFDFPHEITNIWNAAIIEHQPGVYTVKNLVWNQDIPVGGSISFGFTAAASGEITRPTFFAVNTKTTEVAAERIKVEYVLYSDWGSGYSAALKITNLSATSIEDWTIDFDFARSINNLSCGKIVAQNGTHYTIQNDGYTQNLSAGQTIQLGLGGAGGVAADVPTTCVVKQIVPGFDLVSDTDGDLVLDWIEICVNGTDPLIPGEVIPSPTPTEPTPTSVEPTPTTVEPSPTPPVDMETDTDGDLIPNYYEELLGTDPSLADTDGDGLSDYEEVFTLGFDPLSTDSDADGISDYDEDVDQDGLSFRQEKQAGTDSYNNDTDADELLDGEEINIYGTNPLVADTDGDGLDEGDEIALGLNPLAADTNGDGVSDLYEKIQQTVTEKISEEGKPEITEVTVSMNTAGNIQETTKIRNVYNVDVQTSDVVGLIGAPVEITSDSTFDEATINFRYDDSLLGDTLEENLAVMWYDEVNNEYIVLDDEDILDMTNNTISYTTTHFSTYMVVDKVAWFEAWRQGLNTISAARDQYYSSIPVPNLDIVFAVQGNMSSSFLEKAATISSNFMDTMIPGDRCALIYFGEKAYLWGFRSEANAYDLISLMNTCITNRNTYAFMLDLRDDVPCLVHAVGGANAQISSDNEANNMESKNQKIVIILSDGINISRTGGDWVYDAHDYDPTVYAVRMSSIGASDSTLQSFAEDNGGELYIADTSQNIMKAISENQLKNQKVKIDNTDADEDALPDIFETTGILLSNGRIVYTDPTNPDSDYDGILDGKEVGLPVAISSLTQGEKITFYQGAGYTTMYNYCFKYLSNPKMKDTDGDEYADMDDPRPKISDVTVVALLDSEKFVEINDGTKLCYGGEQAWFKDPTGNAGGCATIAAANITAYLASQSYYGKDYSALYSPSSVPHNSPFTFSKKDFITHMYNVYSFVIPMEIVYIDYIDQSGKPHFSVAGTIGVWPMSLFVSNVEAYADACGVSLNPVYKNGQFNKENATEYIIDGLGKNIPVAMFIALNDRLNNTEAFYPDGTPSIQNFERHWVTITEIKIDEISGETTLKVSTWGRYAYLSLDDYLAGAWSIDGLMYFQ